MKTSGIVHLPSFGFIPTIFTGYKGNPSGKFQSAQKNFIRIQSLGVGFSSPFVLHENRNP